MWISHSLSKFIPVKTTKLIQLNTAEKAAMSVDRSTSVKPSNK